MKSICDFTGVYTHTRVCVCDDCVCVLEKMKAFDYLV